MKTDRRWPVGIVVSMIVFVAAMLGVVTVAVQHRPELISDNYYSEGSNLKELKDRRAAGEATGWHVRVRAMPVTDSAVPLAELTVTQTGDVPCDSLTGHVKFYRPSDKTLDIASAAFFSIGGGRYLVKLPRPLEHGSWQAVAHLERGRFALDTRVNFFVEQ